MSKRTKFLSLIGVIATLVVGWQIAAYAGPVGTNSGFEDDDGNLVVNSTFDWNGFAPVTWTGTAPHRSATATASGWQFAGKEDAVAPANDDAFGGGTKQDKECPTVNETSSAPNKDDMTRIYLASKTVPVGGTPHVFLNLGWVRTALNNTSASAHVGFEFNQSTTACPAGSNGLVQRTRGDMLIVYDFEGSSSGTPTLTLKRWLTATPAPSDSAADCETSRTLPCWGKVQNLTASGFAEGKVNTAGAVVDAIKPPGASDPQAAEFGEAGIDLTAAGVFGPNTCTNFGKAYAVSRSSGNSANAQMKDLVGPGNFSLNNCGTVTIIKHTNPGGLDQNFGFTSNLAGGQINCTSDSTPASFDLNDAGTDTETCTNVPIGNYTVTEGADPTGFTLGSLSCTATGSGTGAQDGTVPKQANIGIVAGGDTVTCTYVNNQQTGTIKIIKQTDPRGVDQNFDFTSDIAGAQVSCTADTTPDAFTLNDNGNAGKTPGSTDPADNSAGNTETCTNVPLGNYHVTEGADPTGFTFKGINCTAGGSQDGQIPKQANITVTADSTVTCVFTNSKLGTIKIIKQTDPRGIDQNFDFTSNIAGAQVSCTADTTPDAFTLNDNGNAGKTLGSTDPADNSTGNTETCTNVPLGNYTVTEGDNPTGFSLTDVTCTTGGTGSAQNRNATIDITAGSTVTCVFRNTQQLGAIKVTKTSSKTGNLLTGAQFSVTGPGGFETTLTTDDTGTACVDGLDFGTYTVTETVAPDGFVIDDPSGQTVTVDNNADCVTTPFGGETPPTFTDTPTADIQVNFKDGGSGETSLVSDITCDNTTGDAPDTTPATGWDASTTITGIEAPATIHCTIDIDP